MPMREAADDPPIALGLNPNIHTAINFLVLI